MWSRDARELFYRRLSDGAMMAARIRTTPTLAIESPAMLFGDPERPPTRPPQTGSVGGRFWDLAPDGRFLIIKTDPPVAAVGQANGFVLIQNWVEELKRTVTN